MFFPVDNSYKLRSIFDLPRGTLEFYVDDQLFEIVSPNANVDKDH